MKKLILTILLANTLLTAIQAQSLAVNTDGTAAHSSALLDVKSTTKGLLIPRMTKAQKNAIASPATGLLIFQESPDSTGFYYYDGSLWVWLATANPNTAWYTNGNGGTNASLNFLGTTDNQALSFRQNNLWLGRLNSTTKTYAIGAGAGENAPSIQSVIIGDSAFGSGSASQAVVIGAEAARINNSTGSVVIGYGASRNNTTPGVAIGYQSQQNQGNPTNTSLGSFTLSAGSTGANNLAVGYNSLPVNTTGFENTALGANSLLSNVSGLYNTAVGSSSLRSNVSGTSNSAFGTNSLRFLTEGTNNVAAGISAIAGMEISNFSIGIGATLVGGSPADTSTNNIAIGYFSQYSTKNSIGNVSIGRETMRNAAYGNYNVAIGDSALKISGNGNLNVAIGRAAGLTMNNSNENVYIGAYSGNQTPFFFYNTANNTFIGHRSGINTVDGAIKNVFVGDSSGRFVTNGTYNTLLGANTAVGNGSITNAGAIGYKAYVNQDNSLILGGINGVNGATADTRVGIGTSAPNTNSLFSVTNNFMVQSTGSLQYSNSVNNMMLMFESGSSNADRMVIAHSPSFLNYGLQYQDVGDKFNFLGAGTPVLTIDLTNFRTGVNTSSPNSTLHADGTFAVGVSQNIAGGALATPTLLQFTQSSYIGLAPSGVNQYYHLPDPATCTGRIYYIRNNDNGLSAWVGTAAALLCPGSGVCLGAGSFYELRGNTSVKTIMAISDGVNWTIGKID